MTLFQITVTDCHQPLRTEQRHPTTAGEKVPGGRFAPEAHRDCNTPTLSHPDLVTVTPRRPRTCVWQRSLCGAAAAAHCWSPSPGCLYSRSPLACLGRRRPSRSLPRRLQARGTAGLGSPSGLVPEFWGKLQGEVFTVAAQYLCLASPYIPAKQAVQRNEK